MNVDLTTSRMQQEKAESKRARDRLGSHEVWLAGHTLSLKILGFFPKFPCKSLKSLLPLILEIWKENLGKKILEKGNHKIGIPTLFRSRNLWM
jgi:hypothetical protein